LREAIHQTVHPHDIEGTARAWMPTVQALLRSSPSFNITVETCSERATQLLQVTQRYVDILRQQNQVDSAEVLWRAVEQQPNSVPVLIYGYFQPRLDELTLIDAIAADGSIVVLPLELESFFVKVALQSNGYSRKAGRFMRLKHHPRRLVNS
jgi:hypothetical protein